MTALRYFSARLVVFVALLAMPLSAGVAQTGSVNTNATSGTAGVDVETLGATYPDIALKAYGAFRFFDPSSLELLRLTTDGRLQLGIPPTTDSTLRLHVYENVNRASIVQVENANAGSDTVSAFRARSDVAAVNIQAHSSVRNLTRYGQSMAGWTEIMNWAGNGIVLSTLPSTPMILATSGIPRINIQGNGNVGIGTAAPDAPLTIGMPGGSGNKVTVNGDVTVTGNIAAKYQDVAEWVPASGSMQPGMVVVLDVASANAVAPSSTPYDTRVAGVVSAEPGILLGEAAPTKAKIATTGRVKVHVDASMGAINVGDLLVTSGKRGMAMRSEPIDVGGVRIHRPGTLIGKALEPLANGEGDILVLLSLQ